MRIDFTVHGSLIPNVQPNSAASEATPGEIQQKMQDRLFEMIGAELDGVGGSSLSVEVTVTEDEVA